VSARVVALLGRTSDRSALGAAGAAALGAALAERLGVELLEVGAAGAPRDGRWADDLRDGRAAIAAAGTALEAALDAGELPVLLAADCTVAIATVPLVAAREPEARLVWLDAHGDFNTPETTASGFLGGMCLSAACGRWDAGFPGAFDPARVVLGDARDLEHGERLELERAGVALVAPGDMAAAVRGERVFLHIDLDVLDPCEMPFSFPAAHGLSLDALRSTLAAVASAADLVGIQVASIAPGAAGRLADALEPVLPAG
jgi:arginase family enzyme